MPGMVPLRAPKAVLALVRPMAWLIATWYGLQKMCTWGGESTFGLERVGHSAQENVMGGRVKCSVSTDGPNQTQQEQSRPSVQNLQACSCSAWKSRANGELDLLRYQWWCFKSQDVLIPKGIPCTQWSFWKEKKTQLKLDLKKSKLVYLSDGEATCTVRWLLEWSLFLAIDWISFDCIFLATAE